MKLIQLVLLALAILLAASAANAQSMIGAISEYEGGLSRGAYTEAYKSQLEFEYEAEEGGVFAVTYTDFFDQNPERCDFTCTTHVIFQPGAVNFITTYNPGGPDESNYYYGRGDLYTVRRQGEPCNSEEILTATASVRIFDYTYMSYKDRLYSYGHICQNSAIVELEVIP